jgi:hypothetical protein
MLMTEMLLQYPAVLPARTAYESRVHYSSARGTTLHHWKDTLHSKGLVLHLVGHS